MPSGTFVADSYSFVTDSFGGTDLLSHATAVAGAKPLLWGRYFTSVSTSGEPEYRHAQESAPLAAAGVGVLPVARQTRHVSGLGLSPSDAAALGRNDGVANAVDFFTSFGTDALAAQGPAYLMFLDVESGGKLSPAYYRGWSDGLQQEANARSLGKVTLLPALYLSQGDDATWAGLATSLAAGATCAALWIARWLRRGQGAVPAWDDRAIAPRHGIPAGAPVYFWQYASDYDPANHPGDPPSDGFDYNQTNPALDINATIRPKFFFPAT